MPTKVTGILPTGRYQIRNEFTEKYLRLNVGDDVATMACAINHPEELQMWNINDSGGGTYTIRNYANGYSANVQRPVQEGTYVIASGSGTARLFVIKETLVPGNYRIFTEKEELYLILTGGDPGTIVTLGKEGDRRNIWTFWTR